MMNPPRVLASLLDVNIAPILHAFLGEIEIVALGIMSAKSRERPVGRPLQHGYIGVFLFNTRASFLDVINVDTKMMQPRIVARFPADNRHADVAVADTDGIIGLDRLFLFGRARLGSSHAEYGFVEFGFAHEIFADDRNVLNSG